eukprot:TRINITY_DN13655_c0_g1_i1.p1 TRINITY_DN13655_c0_g1~~TRINITY_DN13655_c0_g1_i1.p1  ORF type:complete len:110 (-),score=8.33 TRINITY_DN13655_c0_g1_i1:89-418(-)
MSLFHRKDEYGMFTGDEHNHSEKVKDAERQKTEIFQRKEEQLLELAIANEEFNELSSKLRACAVRHGHNSDEKCAHLRELLFQRINWLNKIPPKGVKADTVVRTDVFYE